ncbi:MAG: MATE family efflux transporter [Candidatus Fusobacterium pullicola]|uniref:Multidrug export protein MepA n=1 Tax=Candidatus Fusobacterium pullicola TaxID=2838601 RepID=A0A9E2NWD7_9FUSO|nr:MATE family efflux transporter [Candidatus Fusobacterium pullicola]
MENRNDFSQGSIYRHIMSLAIPMTIAQMVQVLYNIVDRIYIGHLEAGSSLALTGLGLTFPIITIISAFTNLFGMGGAPLCSIARGKNDMERAETIMGNTFFLLLVSSFVLMLASYVFMKPLLYMFGASDTTYPYAKEYLKIYLLGTPFVMLGTGMNGFINSQGFGKIGMMTILLGAIVNIILDPIFIFYLKLGISGAAIATILSQLLSAIWVMKFLLGEKTILKLTKKNMRLEGELIKSITGLGLAGFVMSATNGAVQIVCNATLKGHGGDIYVGIMTVLSSIRDVIILPIHGVTTGAQPVLGYNYGAKKYDRIKKGIIFVTVVTVIYMLLAWIIVFLYPGSFIKVFSSDMELIVKGIPAMNIYYFGFFMMAFQVAGQSIFVALGQSKQAVFFSLFRKIIVVVPLTLFLPYVADLGIKGVFLAEPISNFIGGAACYIVMLFTIKKLLNSSDN